MATQKILVLTIVAIGIFYQPQFCHSKKFPSEDKNVKKPLSTIDDFRKMLKSGIARCEKFIDKNRQNLDCYRCKDPSKSFSTIYEHCSFLSGSKGQDFSKRPTRSNRPEFHNYKSSEIPGNRAFSRRSDDEEPEYEKSAYGQKKTNKKHCQTIQRDSETCEVCKNPKNGAQSEQCFYSSEPKDKFFKYSSSKSFGKNNDKPKKNRQHFEDSSDEESGKVAKKVNGKKNKCRQVKKGSMNCEVCYDPNRGGEFERCDYAYEPDDKVFAYTKSKSFGNEKNSNDEEAEESEQDDFFQPQDDEDDFFGGGDDDDGYDFGSYFDEKEEDQENDEADDNYNEEDGEEEENKEDVEESKKTTQRQPKDSGVDDGFQDAAYRREKIQKIVRDISNDEKSNAKGPQKKKFNKCRETVRNGMSCYRCTDNRGVTSEECAFLSEVPSTISTTTGSPVPRKRALITVPPQNYQKKALEVLGLVDQPILANSSKPIGVATSGHVTNGTQSKIRNVGGEQFLIHL